MRREERVTVQGPVKEQQPDGMSHRGLATQQWPARPVGCSALQSVAAVGDGIRAAAQAFSLGKGQAIKLQNQNFSRRIPHPKKKVSGEKSISQKASRSRRASPLFLLHKRASTSSTRITHATGCLASIHAALMADRFLSASGVDPTQRNRDSPEAALAQPPKGRERWVEG